MKRPILKSILLRTLIILVVISMAACASSKPQKRSQPKKGPIPCPVKDC